MTRQPSDTPDAEERFLQHLIAQYPGEEAEQVRAYLLTTASGRGVLAALREDPDAIRHAPVSSPIRNAMEQGDVNGMLDRLMQQVRRDGHSNVGEADRRIPDIPRSGLRPNLKREHEGRTGRLPFPGHRPVWYGLAGAVLGLLFLVIGWQGGIHQTNTAVVADGISTYTTGNGQRATITLPDGSVVMLNVASRLEVPTNYSASHRTLRLSGEALFSVNHDADNPLTVIAGPSVTRVLGTSFIVRHYATDTVATVAVQDGKVAVGPTVLTARQQVQVGARGLPQMHRFDPTQFTFTNGILTLNSVPLADAVVDLSRWYDADIRLGDPTLATQRVRGEFVSGSLADLANILELTFNVRVVREQRRLTLFPK